MDNPIKTAIKQICAEKGLSEESVLETINSALAAAYRKDFGDKNQNIVVNFDIETADMQVYDEKEVVEDLTPEELAEMEKNRLERETLKEKIASGEITSDELRRLREEREAEEKDELIGEGAEENGKRKFNPKTQIQLNEAKTIKKKYKLGDIIKTKLEIPGDFGRMAAQTAKQVIIQKIREAERGIVYQEYKDKEGKVVTGTVQKFDGKNVIIDFEKISAILPPVEQIRGERYKTGDRIKLYVLSVNLTTRGPEIIVSRAHSAIVRNLFENEIPEIHSGVIEIKAIAREAGNRTKIAVFTADDSIDPIGSCIGQRGARIQTIINELSGEKIDIIEYSEDAGKYISQSLSPAKIKKVELDNEDLSAKVYVESDQLSLTIGRAGQNVRLASRLTGWKINVIEINKKETEPEPETNIEPVAPTEK
ncbi:MAG: transcription termination factor NusA [Patescibacteria group bacterium]